MIGLLTTSVLLSGIGALLLFGGRQEGVTDSVAASLLRDGGSEGTEGVKARPERRSIEARRLGCWGVGAALFFAVRVWVTKGISESGIVLAALGALAGELIHRSALRREARQQLQSLERSLPLVMERVVMAAGAGLDVLPAIGEAAAASDDPVSRALRRVVELSERGLPVEEALKVVATSLPSLSVRHAFVHFGLAYKQGGEIVRPLRELSDATQAHYQESIEEEIARLPARAVFPLVVIFAGLIICFLTVPLIQVGSITSRVTTAARGGS